MIADLCLFLLPNMRIIFHDEQEKHKSQAFYALIQKGK
jgi:hypothetical protein